MYRINMLKKILLFLASVLPVSTTIASAQTPSFERLSQLAQAYVEEVGCFDDGVKIDPKNVTEFSDEQAEIEDAFVVMVPADMHCAGGSGTSSFNLILLERAGDYTAEYDPEYKYLKVNVDASEPVAYTNGPRAITSVYKKDGQLFATGLEYASKDPNCCPSIKTIYKVNLKKRVFELNEGEYRTMYSWYFTRTGTY